MVRCYRVFASSGFGEENIKLVEVIGDNKTNIEKFVKEVEDEMFAHAVDEAVAHLWNDYEDEDELYDDVGDYVYSGWEEISGKELEDKINGADGTEFNDDEKKLKTYTWCI